ncbi:hypothetical protein [Streptomyces sp. 2231.1]|uniref:hypothetical protein n=1 Tax=Streptomyces sp. 2231.1 TaxID=1855347 RepID=UPI002108A16E|nr:hypothetical protein [Streptomyces sp. 2231.1]
MTLVDTAEAYGEANERLVGEALAPVRDQVSIASSRRSPYPSRSPPAIGSATRTSDWPGSRPFRNYSWLASSSPVPPTASA